MVSDQGRQATARLFVSYSRKDLPVLDDMVARLEARGFAVVFDTRNLPYGEDWQRELTELIRASDSVIWLVSNASIVSRWCNWEVTEVERLKKRLVPVVIEQIDPNRLPVGLGRIQMLPRTGVYDPELHFSALAEALETDLEWVKLHTRLADRAYEWQSRNRARDRLLRGRALADAELWLDHRPNNAPTPTTDVFELIRSSRRAATQRLGALGAIAGIVAIVTVVLAGFAWQQRNAARNEAEISALQRDVAIARLGAQDNPIGSLRGISAAGIRNQKDTETGITPILSDVYAGLFELLAVAREQPPLGGGGDGIYGGVGAINIDEAASNLPARLLIATREQVLVTDRIGRVLSRPVSGPDLGPAYANTAIWIGHGKYAVATGEFSNQDLLNPGIEIYDNNGGQVARLLADNPSPIISLAYLDQADLILAGDALGNLYRVDVKALKAIRISEGFGAALLGITAKYDAGLHIVLAYGRAPPFMQPERRVAGSTANLIKPAVPAHNFEKSDSEAIAGALGIAATVFAVSTQGTSTACLVAGDYSEVFVCDERGGVSLWSTLNQPDWPPFSVKDHFESGRATALSYSQDLDAIAIGDDLGRIRVWSKQGQPLTPILQHAQGAITALGFADHGRTLLSTGADLTIRNWDLGDLSGGRHSLRPAGLSPESTAQSPDGSVRIAYFNRFDKGKFVTVFDARNSAGEVRRRDFALPPDALPANSMLSPHDLSVARDGDRLAWALPSSITVAQIGSSNTLASIPLEKGWTAARIALSANGRELAIAEQALQSASGNASGPLRYRRAFYRVTDDTLNWTLVQQLDVEQDQIVTAILALPTAQGSSKADGEAIFAFGDSSGSISFWNAAGKKLGDAVALSPANSPIMAVENLAISADGKLLLASLHRSSTTLDPNPAADFYSHIAVITVANQKTVTALTAVHRNVTALALSSDGALVLVATSIGPLGKQLAGLAIYDTATLRQLGTIPIPDDDDVPNAVWLDPDGRAHVATRFLKESTWPVTFDSLLELAQEHVARWDTEDRYRSLAQQAADARQKKDTASAIDFLRQAAKIRQDLPGPLIQFGNLVYDPLSGVGDKSAAVAAYDAALSINPFDILARARRGRFRYFTGNLSGAEEDYKEAVDLPMTYIPISRNYAPFLSINAQIYNLSVKFRKNSRYELWAFLGYVLYAEHKWPDAISILSKAISEFVGSVRDREFRAYAYANIGNYPAALDDMNDAFNLLSQGSGSYSGLDDFKGQATSAAGKQRLLCSFAMSAADWAERDRSEGKPNTLAQINWLRQAVTACSNSWRGAPQPNAPGPTAILSLKSRLAQLGVTIVVPDDIAVPLSEQLQRLIKNGDLPALQTFRTHYAEFDEAAEAGEAISRLSLRSIRTDQPSGTIIGTWQMSDGNLKIRIENGRDGKEVWRRLGRGSAVSGDPIAETAPSQASRPWDHIGKHAWDTAPPSWGQAGALVAEVIDTDHLFYAYLDSRYKGGWLLQRTLH